MESETEDYEREKREEKGKGTLTGLRYEARDLWGKEGQAIITSAELWA